jgi:hypothetical protein
LVFPGAKTIHDSKPAAAAANRDGQLSPAQAAVQAACQPKMAAAQTVVDAICHKQVCSMHVVFATKTACQVVTDNLTNQIELT